MARCLSVSLLCLQFYVCLTYNSNWMVYARGSSEPRCVDIPRNFSLCTGLEYERMRIPNLLDQESLAEAMDQSAFWLPVLRVNCHPDAKMFLCSLFAPVCIKEYAPSIQPCQSLCHAVRDGCSERMRHYGFPWPEMLRCDKFPVENDMCIKPIHGAKQTATHSNSTDQSAPSGNRPPSTRRNRLSTCPACHQTKTYENMVDNFCRSSHVLKVKIKSIDHKFLQVRRGRSIKPKNMRKRSISNRRLYLRQDENACRCRPASRWEGKFLAMGTQNPQNGNIHMNMFMPWKRDKVFKRALRAFRKIDCRNIGERMRNRARRARQHRRRGRSRNVRDETDDMYDVFY